MPYTSTTPTDIANYISQQATLRGINPETAVGVARTEGLNNPVGDAGRSFGPYQLYVGGGLGNSFQKETGLNPANYEQNWPVQVQWFLNWAVQHGWNPGGVGLGSSYQAGTGGGSHGASLAGISNWQGLLGSHTLALDLSGNVGGGGSPETTTSPTGGGASSKGDGSTVTSTPTPETLDFGQSLQHLAIQGGLVFIAIALLIGGIILIAMPAIQNVRSRI